MTWTYFIMLLVAVCVDTSVQAGDFWTHCHDRHFWVTIKSTFLAERFTFNFEDRSGFHFPSDREASRCGYTALRNHLGDLVFRASFLACHVQSQNDREYSLHMWFVNRWANGTAAAYPLRLHCALRWPWGAREIVCEENYMEVSVQLPMLDPSLKAQPEAAASELSVLIHGRHRPEGSAERVMSGREASDLGYCVSRAGGRLLLRAAYSSPLSYTVQEKGVDVEVLSASIFHSVQGVPQAVRTTAACNRNRATVDGSDLLWTDPHAVPQLSGGRLLRGAVRLGVGPLVLSAGQARERGYRVRLEDGLLQVRIPLASPGVDLKSGVVGGRYGQAAAVQLFFMRQWADERWPLTQQRLLRTLGTPFRPRPPWLSNDTVASAGVFDVTLGCFPWDVSLDRVAVGGGGGLLWDRTTRGPAVSRVSHSNGSHSYRLRVPFAHAGVVRERKAGGYSTRRLPLTFELSVSPRGEAFLHHATVESSVQDSDEPGGLQLEAQCSERSLLVRLHYGARGPDHLQWELYLGGRRLDMELVRMGRFRLEDHQDSLHLEVPLHGPGMEFEEVALARVVARAELSVVDLESQRVQDRLVQRCTFAPGEILACLPEGRVVAVVDTTHAAPPVRPERTTLADPGCVPMETDSARALFVFGVESCGTTLTTEGDQLVYENQVRYQQEFLPGQADPLIHRDSPYRLTIQCRYPTSDSRILFPPPTA